MLAFLLKNLNKVNTLQLFSGFTLRLNAYYHIYRPFATLSSDGFDK